MGQALSLRETCFCFILDIVICNEDHDRREDTTKPSCTTGSGLEFFFKKVKISYFRFSVPIS